MKQIYTRTGDGGTTSLRGGMRVPKDDLRIETNGQIDHLNAMLGIVRAQTGGQTQLLKAIQCELMIIMSHIATPDGESNERVLHADQLTRQMETAIDQLTEGKSVGFVVPGETLAGSFIHLARTQTRTVERRLWALHKEHPVETCVLTFFNRLSDYLFALSIV